MIKWIKRRRRLKSLLKRREMQPKAYAIRQPGSWVKAVLCRKPDDEHGREIIGPFRSEVDCEEFCDRTNRYALSGVIMTYSDIILTPEERRRMGYDKQ